MRKRNAVALKGGMFAMAALSLFAICGCGQKEPSIYEIEQGMKDSFRRKTGAFSAALDADARRVGNGRWEVKLTVERYGERRSLNATAVMDKNGDIHYYTD